MNDTLKMTNQHARWKLYHMLNHLLRSEQSQIEKIKHKRPESKQGLTFKLKTFDDWIVEDTKAFDDKYEGQGTEFWEKFIV